VEFYGNTPAFGRSTYGVTPSQRESQYSCAKREKGKKKKAVQKYSKPFFVSSTETRSLDPNLRDETKDRVGQDIVDDHDHTAVSD